MKWLGEPNENPFMSADIAEPVGVFILNHFPNQRGPVPVKSVEQLVNIVNGEHKSQVSERVHRSDAMIRGNGR